MNCAGSGSSATSTTRPQTCAHFQLFSRSSKKKVARRALSMRVSHSRVEVPLNQMKPSCHSYQIGVISGLPRSLSVHTVASRGSAKKDSSRGPIERAITALYTRTHVLQGNRAQLGSDFA